MTPKNRKRVGKKPIKMCVKILWGYKFKNIISKCILIFIRSVSNVMLRNAQINQNRIRNFDYGIVYNMMSS
jgi:hypothetical protein